MVSPYSIAYRRSINQNFVILKPVLSLCLQSQKSHWFSTRLAMHRHVETGLDLVSSFLTVKVPALFHATWKITSETEGWIPSNLESHSTFSFHCMNWPSSIWNHKIQNRVTSRGLLWHIQVQRSFASKFFFWSVESTWNAWLSVQISLNSTRNSTNWSFAVVWLNLRWILTVSIGVLTW